MTFTAARIVGLELIAAEVASLMRDDKYDQDTLDTIYRIIVRRRASLEKIVLTPELVEESLCQFRKEQKAERKR